MKGIGGQVRAGGSTPIGGWRGARGDARSLSARSAAQRTVAAPVSPSFACSGKLTRVEQAICDDPALAQRDRDLDALYKLARARPGIADGQRVWIRNRNACTDAPCIARAYDQRIGELRAALR